jgi:hypothetical protein
MSDSRLINAVENGEIWPELAYENWKDTYATLHMWTQIVGKVRLAFSPNENHYWHCVLYVTARGLTTPPMPYKDRTVEIDTIHCSYDAEYANRWWRILVQTDRVFKQFRGRFLGKCSPSHFFWGSFDLAVTRFSGPRAREREGADAITRKSIRTRSSAMVSGLGTRKRRRQCSTRTPRRLLRDWRKP